MLTNKGKKMFDSLKKDLDPYVNVAGTLRSPKVLRYTKKAQTHFKKV